MVTSWGEAAARGVEAGFGLGLRADQAAEEKRSHAVQEQRQAGADLRSEQELGLRRDAEARQERRLGDAERRDVQGRATTALEGRRKELLAAGQAAGVSGAPVPAGLQEEYGQVSARLAALRQQALDDASRLASGQVSLDSMAPAQLFRTVTLGSGMAPKDLQAMPQHAADLQAGMSTGNNGLVLQSVNGLLAPALRVGVGTPSPYGGTISRKEIIGLDPAQDANGVDHPGKVIPRLRVYVQRPGEAGERYYDAPMTMDRSGNPDDKVAAIDIRKALDWVGNLGTLTTALQRPDLQEKLAQGEREAGPEVRKYFDEFNLAIKPGKKSVTHETVDLGGYLLDRERGPDGSLVSERRLEKTAVPKDRASGEEDLKHRLALLDSERASGRLDDAEYKQRRADLISGIKSRQPAGKGGDSGGGYSEMYGKDQAYREKVDFYAKLMKSGGPRALPPRFAQSGAGKAMMPDVLLRLPELGDDPREMLANEAELGGAKAGARTVGTRAANFALAKSEAYEMADLVTAASEKIGRTDFIPINKAIISYERNTGDPDVVQYGAALNSFIQAYVRAVAPIGQPPLQDKQHARRMLEEAQSHDQVKAVIAQLKREMEAAGRAPGVVRQQQREAVTTGLGLGAAPGRPATAQPPAQRPVTATNPQTGEKLMLQNGQWVPMQ